MFSEILAQERMRRQLSQKELATLCHVSLSTIKNWETGSTDPSISNLLTLSKILAVSTVFLLGLTSSKIINLDCLSDEEFQIANQLLQTYILTKKRDDRT